MSSTTKIKQEDLPFEIDIQDLQGLTKRKNNNYIIVNEILRTKEIPEMKEELVNGLLSYDEKMRTDIINKFALIMK